MSNDLNNMGSSNYKTNTTNESQVVVKKISNPPLITAELIHKFVKLIILLVIIGLSIKGLLIVKDRSYEFLLNDANKTVNKKTDVATVPDSNNQAATPDPTTVAPDANTTPSPGAYTPNASTPSNGTNTAPRPNQQTTVVNCGVAGMPQGVCLTIQSIERDGVKGNANVEADTSGLPDGVKVDVNESSWQAVDANNGKVSFTMLVAGTTYNGTAVLQLKDGAWKVVNYYSS